MTCTSSFYVSDVCVTISVYLPVLSVGSDTAESFVYTVDSHFHFASSIEVGICAVFSVSFFFQLIKTRGRNNSCEESECTYFYYIYYSICFHNFKLLSG